MTSTPPGEPGDGSVEDVAALDGPLEAGDGHPLSEVRAAAEAEAQAGPDREYGVLGPPLDRHTPFVVGFAATLGVAAAFALVWAAYEARGLLIDVGLGLFIALGLDPAVSWLQRRGLPRWAAVVAVVIAGLALLAGIASEVVPVVTRQVTNLVNAFPKYERLLTSHSGFLGHLDSRYHIVSRIKGYVSTHGSTLAGGVVGVGKLVLNGVLETIIVAVVSVYFLAALPRVKRVVYQLAPRSRRARVVLLGDEMFAKVGGYVLGNVFVSIVAGVATWAWAAAFGIPYALLMAILVAILDLVPLVGSTIGGIIVALVALTVSLPLAIATVAFYVVFRMFEDHLLTPQVMGRTVKVPSIVTVIATLIGGTLLGIPGALVAIPIAAAVKLLVEQVAMPTMNRR